jgi:hypothetical protein
MRKHLETGLMGLIALACAAFAAVLVRGPAQGEERTMQDAWQAWQSWWSGDRVAEERTLARDEVLRLPAGREGSSVRVEVGSVIVTREGDPEDHVLQAGAELHLPGRGLSLAWALEPSRVEIRRGAERVGEQPATAGRLSEAR